MSVLFQMQSGQVEFLICFNFFRCEGGSGCFRNLFDSFRFSPPTELLPSVGTVDDDFCFTKVVDGDQSVEHLFRREVAGLFKTDVSCFPDYDV